MARPFDCILAVDAKLGIGKDNKLPWPRLKTDMQVFKQLTTGCPSYGFQQRRAGYNAVIMGRNTFESMPKGLPNRLNVVVTSQDRLKVVPGIWTTKAPSLDEALKQLPADLVDDAFVIGGAQLYREAFKHPMCRSIYLTRIEQEFECDTFIELPFEGDTQEWKQQESFVVHPPRPLEPYIMWFDGLNQDAAPQRGMVRYTISRWVRS